MNAKTAVQLLIILLLVSVAIIFSPRIDVGKVPATQRIALVLYGVIDGLLLGISLVLLKVIRP